MSKDRPRCTTCKQEIRADEPDRRTCKGCELRVEEDLNALSGRKGLYARLVVMGTDALMPNQSVKSDRVSGASRSSAPAPLVIPTLSLMANGGVVSVLNKWVTIWYKALGFHHPRWFKKPVSWTTQMIDGKSKEVPGQLDMAAKALLNNLPWAVENREDFRDFSMEVHDLTQECSRAVDPEKHEMRIRIGRCPTKFDTGETCNAWLSVGLWSQSIKCAGCGTRWARDEWTRLGDNLRDKQ